MGKVGFVLVLVTLSKCFMLSQGISIYDNKPILSEEDKRGGITDDSKNQIFSNKESQLAKSNTAKRGILPAGGGQRHYGDDDLSPPRYGDYEGGRYGGTGGGYPHPSGIGHLGDDRGPPYYEPDGGYHHSGGGVIGGRPSGYGPGPGPAYGPPHAPYPPYGPPYHGGYDDQYHQQDHSGHDQGIGGFKALSLKKILIPLAGLAILGVAAAASQNPVLLQLGSVHGRRKRSLPPPNTYPSNPAVKPLKID